MPQSHTPVFSMKSPMKTTQPSLIGALLSCAALLAVAPQALLAHSATEASPRSDAFWKERQTQLNTRARDAGKKAKVLFIGDSITQGWEGDGKEVWSKFYAHRNAVNLGIGGDRTQHVLWRLDNGNLEDLEPKAAVVMIGTNNSNGEDNTPEQIVEGVAAIVAKLRQKLPQTHVLLLAIFPRNENFSPIRGKLTQINQVLQKLADGDKVHWLDIGHRFLNTDGTLPREIMPDYLHLSTKGYTLWATAIEDKLSSLLSDSRVLGGDVADNPSLAGEWIWTIQGPDGKPVESLMVLKTEGTGVTGKMQRGADSDRWLEVLDGKSDASGFSWRIKRDRPGGGDMTYHMTGKFESGKIVGVAKTQMNGEDVSVPWHARRK